MKLYYNASILYSFRKYSAIMPIQNKKTTEFNFTKNAYATSELMYKTTDML